MERERARSVFLAERMVAVLRTATRAEAQAAGNAVLAGGARLLEVTLTVPEAMVLIRELKAAAPATALIGAGTVLSVADLERALAAGADFLISPDVNPEVIAAAAVRNVFHVPGAMTPSEVTAARRAGADFVKLFPIGSLGGAAHVRAVRGPLPDVPFLATGGVDLDNLDDFLAAGVAAVGLSNTLVVPEWLAKGELQRITTLTAAYRARLSS